MIRSTFLAALMGIAFAGAALAQQAAPGTVYAEGVDNPDVTPETLKRTVCKPGWTKKVRPATSYTNKLKLAQLAEHPELEDRNPAHYEGDHKKSEEDGGHPSDPANIRLQPWATAFGAKAHTCNPQKYGYTAECKDIVETALHRDLCKGVITLDEAREILAGDDAKWIVELVRRSPKYAITN